MLQKLHNFLAKIFGQNFFFTPKSTIIDQMNEPRALPIGMNEFEEWSNRIISGTLLPAELESQKFALAAMLINLSPTTDHESDGYFIKSLRKGAINQIATAKMNDIKKAFTARQEAEKLKLEIDPEPSPSKFEVIQGNKT